MKRLTLNNLHLRALELHFFIWMQLQGNSGRTGKSAYDRMLEACALTESLGTTLDLLSVEFCNVANTEEVKAVFHTLAAASLHLKEKQEEALDCISAEGKRAFVKGA